MTASLSENATHAVLARGVAMWDIPARRPEGTLRLGAAADEGGRNGMNGLMMNRQLLVKRPLWRAEHG